MAHYDKLDLSGSFDPSLEEPTVDFPHYRKQRQEEVMGGDPVAEHHGSAFFMIVCDEGWRTSIVCSGMYEWAADWLIKVIDGRPFATKERP